MLDPAAAFLILFPLPCTGEEEDGPVLESGEGDDSYWKKKEAFFRGSTMSLGEKFSSGTFKDAFRCRLIVCCNWNTSFNISQSKLVIFHTQTHSPCVIFMHTDEAHFPTNVLLTQQSRSIHHIPPGSSSQMDLNGHTESPVRGLIALLFLRGLASQSVSLKYELSWKIFNELLKVLRLSRDIFPFYSMATDRKIHQFICVMN